MHRFLRHLKPRRAPGRIRNHRTTKASFSTVVHDAKQRRTLLDFTAKYKSGEPLAMTTCYDYTSAVLADRAELDGLLVGDSYKMVMCGEESTAAATIEELVYHCKAVTRGAKSSFVVCDMPFGSYEVSSTSALDNAIRLVKEGNAHAIKLEGGAQRVAHQINSIVQAGIPVMGHIGLTPQTANSLGGFQVQGRSAEQAAALVEDAKALEAAGCFAVVIESVPQKIAAFITKQLNIPTIGIGAGCDTSGQILVWHDMFGLFQDFTPKFCKQYAALGKQVEEGLQKYRHEVTQRTFPGPEHSYKLKQEQWDKFRQYFNIAFPSPSAPGKTSNPNPELSVATNSAATSSKPSSELKPVSNPAASTLERQPTPVPVKKEEQPIPTLSTQSPPREKGVRHLKIAIIGGGAMGSLIASRIASSSANPSASYTSTVWMVSSWAEHVNAINTQGLSREELAIGKTARAIVPGIHATTNPSDVVLSDGTPPDVILILVKSPNTHIAAQKAQLMIQTAASLSSSANTEKSLPTTPKTITIVTLQNGMGNFETLRRIISTSPLVPALPHTLYNVHFVQGVTEHGALMAGPGHVRHTGTGATTLVGDPSNTLNQIVASLLNQCGMNATIQADAKSVIWGKLVLNAAINPITALLGLQNGQILTNSSARKMAKLAAAEAERVAMALGVSLPYPNAWSKVEAVARNTATNKSSMLVDMERGEETEIEAINGVIVREGQKLGIDVEFNKQLLKTFSRLEKSAEL